MTCRSINKPSTSWSLQPRLNDALCSDAMAEASRALASDSDASPREKRPVIKLIIGGPIGRRLAGEHRVPAGKVALVVYRYRSLLRRAALPIRCEAHRAVRPGWDDVRPKATTPRACWLPCR